MVLRSALTLALCVAAWAAVNTADECVFGDGVPAPQPGHAGEGLTCTPTTRTGGGSVRLRSSPNVYRDALTFSYPYPPAKTPPKGRGRVNVALLSLGADGGCAGPNPPASPAAKSERIIAYLRHAGEQSVDLAVLPENAFGRPGEKAACYMVAEPVAGPTVRAVQAIAKRYGMNVVLPIHEARGAAQYNTAVVIDRNGTVVGTYSKVFPVFGNVSQTWNPPNPASGTEVAPPMSVVPSSGGLKVFDLDVGRIAILICFDINFAELWHQAAGLNADFVVWPSAMKTPDPSTYGYARIFQYEIIACGFPGDVVDRTGAQANVTTDPDPSFAMLKYAQLDIDRTFVHWDYNGAKVKTLLAENPAVVKEVAGPPFYLLRSTSPTVSVRKLLHQYEIETAREYVQRSRRGLNLLRQFGPGPMDPGDVE